MVQTIDQFQSILGKTNQKISQQCTTNYLKQKYVLSMSCEKKKDSTVCNRNPNYILVGFSEKKSL